MAGLGPLVRVVAVEPRAGFRALVTFSDDTRREIDRVRLFWNDGSWRQAARARIGRADGWRAASRVAGMV